MFDLFDDEPKEEKKKPFNFQFVSASIKGFISFETQVLRKEYLSPSLLSNLCPRQFWFNYFCPEPRPYLVGKGNHAMNSLKGKLGTFTHEYFQEILAVMGILQGPWKCSNCEEDFEAYPFDHDCGNPCIYYIEPSFEDTELKMRGRCDGILDTKTAILTGKDFSSRLPFDVGILAGFPKRMMLEIKTCSERSFKKIKDERIIPEYYQMQNNIYMHYFNMSHCVFLFVPRDNLKPFELINEYDEGWYNDAVHKVKGIWQAIASKSLPDKVCKGKKSYGAKLCPYVKECFDEKAREVFLKDNLG